MELKIGDRIREMRKKAGRTQEEMASVLGVTPQAVSKWESMNGYPDMETIPALANYFGVTIDALFGYDGERERRVKEICDRADRMLKDRDTDFDALISMLRVAAEEYPANGRLLARLGDALYTAGWKKIGGIAYTTADDPYIHADTAENLKNSYWNEARTLFERVLDMPTPPSERENAVIFLLTLYWEIGEQSKIDELVSAQPSVIVSRERLAAKNAAGSWKPIGDGILTFLRVTADLLIHAASRQRMNAITPAFCASTRRLLKPLYRGRTPFRRRPSSLICISGSLFTKSAQETRAARSTRWIGCSSAQTVRTGCSAQACITTARRISRNASLIPRSFIC